MHFDLTSLYVVQLDIGFLAPATEKMANKLTKYVLINREATIEEMVYSLTSILTVMQGKEVTKGFNALVIALEDNGAQMAK